MSLTSGTRLGAYEVIGLIGSGGMGEVYRAKDTKLGRDVALKVLPDLFADDPERLARFQREAKVLASLNHPNIASIYGLEEAEGVRALVLELVEGPTLAERIAQGAIPVDEALPIAEQIAEAPEAASVSPHFARMSCSRTLRRTCRKRPRRHVTLPKLSCSAFPRSTWLCSLAASGTRRHRCSHTVLR